MISAHFTFPFWSWHVTAAVYKSGFADDICINAEMFFWVHENLALHVIVRFTQIKAQQHYSILWTAISLLHILQIIVVFEMYWNYICYTGNKIQNNKCFRCWWLELKSVTRWNCIDFHSWSLFPIITQFVFNTIFKKI